MIIDNHTLTLKINQFNINKSVETGTKSRPIQSNERQYIL